MVMGPWAPPWPPWVPPWASLGPPWPPPGPPWPPPGPLLTPLGSPQFPMDPSVPPALFHAIRRGAHYLNFVIKYNCFLTFPGPPGITKRAPARKRGAPGPPLGPPGIRCGGPKGAGDPPGKRRKSPGGALGPPGAPNFREKLAQDPPRERFGVSSKTLYFLRKSIHFEVGTFQNPNTQCPSGLLGAPREPRRGPFDRAP